MVVREIGDAYEYPGIKPPEEFFFGNSSELKQTIASMDIPQVPRSRSD